MDSQQIDYGVVLADMEAKRGALDAAIANMKLFLSGHPVLDGLGPPAISNNSAMAGGEVPAGAFLGKSIPEGALLYLEIVKRKATSREIAEALKRGGMESTSSNFQGIVHAVLDRYRKAGGEVVKLDRSMWGLAKWYPAGVRSVAQEKRTPSKKSKAKKAAKGSAVKRTEPKPAVAQPIEVPAKKEGSQTLIEAHFAAHPREEFSAPDLARTLQISISAANLICAKLAHKGKIAKTETGAYHSIEPQAA